jgi:hypothetical protein
MWENSSNLNSSACHEERLCVEKLTKTKFIRATYSNGKDRLSLQRQQKFTFVELYFLLIQIINSPVINSVIMDLSKQHQMNLLTANMSTIGLLELLRLQQKEVKQRTVPEIIDYNRLLNSGSFFTEEMVTAAIGINQFLGAGNTIKDQLISWMVSYTADAATALFVAHVAKRVSKFIYDMVNHYLKEIKVKDSAAKDDKSDTDILENPRRKKKKKIRYEQSLRQVLKNSRYSGLYNMLLDIYQLIYKQRETLTAQDKAKSKVPLPNRLVPFCYVSEHYFFGIWKNSKQRSPQY